MGRPRRAGSRDLPDNLYRNRSGWKYLRPSDGRPIYFRAGTTREEAIEAAKECNAILTKARHDLVGAVMRGRHNIKDAVAIFRKEPNRKWGPKTAREYAIYLNRLELDIGDKRLDEYGVSEAAEFLRAKPLEARRKYRCLMSWVFGCAVQEGWIESNPIEQTRPVPPGERKRERLTKEAFDAIRAKAEPWLQNAMDLGLVSLLRRGDLCAAKFSDIHENRLHIEPKKTKDSTKIRLRIAIGPELAAVLKSCRDEVVSPFLVHRLPEKARPQKMRAKARTHHTQVLPEQLSRAFAEARDLTELRWPGPPPTFHEIRSLGVALYREKGWTMEQVQALAGHATKAMTEAYSTGHEAPWTDVIAG